MQFYTYSGQDSGSDNGHWCVVVQAGSRHTADGLVVEHMQEMGRGDLAIGEPDISQGNTKLVYTDVESGG